MPESTPRQRIRQLIPNLPLGQFPPGPSNSLTDVPGVLVHTQSFHGTSQAGHAINTGVTAILPRRNYWAIASPAGIFSFNGSGEMTGAHWLQETGLLMSPIVFTGTSNVGAVYEGVQRHYYRETMGSDGLAKMFILPVVAETWDGSMSDPGAFVVRPEDVVRGIDEASPDPVKEGNTGGGTGMLCNGYKGGTGSASRIIPIPAGWQGSEKSFTLGALVQANYGAKRILCIGGVPIGRKLAEEDAALEEAARLPAQDGSIVIAIATDAPLSPLQLQRIAKRATVGLAKVGGFGSNYSGDIFLAFSTAGQVPFNKSATQANRTNEMVRDDEMNPLFEATADVVEESIYNAMCMAETMTGPLGKTIEAIDLARVRELVEPRLL